MIDRLSKPVARPNDEERGQPCAAIRPSLARSSSSVSFAFDRMNVFEFNVLASPVGGLVGGVTAAKGLSGTSTLIAAVGGLLVGVGLYFGVFGLGWLTSWIAGLNKKRDGESIHKAASLLSLVVLLPMLVLPIISAVTAHWLIQTIYR